MKPFDLEKAKAGAPVVTRGGTRVTEIHLFESYRGDYPLTGIVGGERAAFTRDGRFFLTGESHNYDLFMASTKETVWANLYRYREPGSRPLGFSYLFETEAEANGYHSSSRPNNGSERIGGKAVAIEIEK